MAVTCHFKYKKGIDYSYTHKDDYFQYSQPEPIKTVTDKQKLDYIFIGDRQFENKKDFDRARSEWL